MLSESFSFKKRSVLRRQTFESLNLCKSAQTFSSSLTATAAVILGCVRRNSVQSRMNRGKRRAEYDEERPHETSKTPMKSTALSADLQKYLESVATSINDERDPETVIRCLDWEKTHEKV